MVENASDTPLCFHSMEKQVNSLPDLFRQLIDSYLKKTEQLIEDAELDKIQRIYLLGSGDSNFVGLTTELAFEAFGHLPIEVMTSLHFSRYAVNYLPSVKDNSTVAIGISVSGRSSRTREALISARKKGLKTIAMTAQDGEFTALANFSLIADTPDFPDPEPNGTPGVRSFAANHLMLIILALQIGKKKGTLSEAQFETHLEKLMLVSTDMQQFLDSQTENMKKIVHKWMTHEEMVFVGAGPNYGAALFSAAKFIEACGDFAIAQETEEWAHLNYYNRKRNTPTIILSAGQSDYTRTREIVKAAQAIGREVLLVSIGGVDLQKEVALNLPLPECEEHVMPLYLCAISSLMASYRADLMGQVYFRQNHTVETSRIRDSEIV